MSQKKIQQSDNHHRIAIGLLKKCDKKRALSHLIKAVEYDPNKFILRHSLAVNYYSLNKYKKALVEFKKSLDLEPKLTDSLVGLAKTYLKLNELDKASNYLKKAEQDLTYPRSLEIIATKALLEYEKGNYLMAQKGFEDVLSLPSGQTCRNYLRLGQSQMYLKFFDKAERNLKKAVINCKKLEKNSCAILDYEEYFALAQLNLKKKNQKKARYYLNLFLKKSNTNTDEAMIEKAQKFLKQMS
ncbi:MAG: tetratricopeptide repeat protein [Bdellovibrionales bacterium]|nr:tetratricopeptide repeat protein [Bdellovibrionales bacterium]